MLNFRKWVLYIIEQYSIKWGYVMVCSHIHLLLAFGLFQDFDQVDKIAMTIPIVWSYTFWVFLGINI